MGNKEGLDWPNSGNCKYLCAKPGRGGVEGEGDDEEEAKEEGRGKEREGWQERREKSQRKLGTTFRAE